MFSQSLLVKSKAHTKEQQHKNLNNKNTKFLFLFSYIITGIYQRYWLDLNSKHYFINHFSSCFNIFLIWVHITMHTNYHLEHNSTETHMYLPLMVSQIFVEEILPHQDTKHPPFMEHWHPNRNISIASHQTKIDEI